MSLPDLRVLRLKGKVEAASLLDQEPEVAECKLKLNCLQVQDASVKVL